MDVVRRQNMSSLCDSGRNVYHALHEHCQGSPIDNGVVGSMSIKCSCFGVGTYDRSEMGDSCLTGTATGLVPVREVLDLSSCRERLLMIDDCRRRAGCGDARAESEAERPSCALWGRLGMDGPAWVVAIEFCNKLICEGRAGRLSDGESLAASRNALRECARRFKVGVRSISRREAAGKKLAMGKPHERALILGW